jgi:hypothetical protein
VPCGPIRPAGSRRCVPRGGPGRGGWPRLIKVGRLGLGEPGRHRSRAGPPVPYRGVRRRRHGQVGECLGGGAEGIVPVDPVVGGRSRSDTSTRSSPRTPSKHLGPEPRSTRRRLGRTPPVEPFVGAPPHRQEILHHRRIPDASRVGQCTGTTLPGQTNAARSEHQMP